MDLEDVVLHDIGMDIRGPTHALIRAHASLWARRHIAAEAPDWALSEAGLGVRGRRRRARRGQGTSRRAFWRDGQRC